MAPTANVATTARRAFLRFIVRPFSAFHCCLCFGGCKDPLQQGLECLDFCLGEAFKEIFGDTHRGGECLRVELPALGCELEPDGPAVLVPPHATHEAALLERVDLPRHLAAVVAEERA